MESQPQTSNEQQTWRVVELVFALLATLTASGDELFVYPMSLNSIKS